MYRVSLFCLLAATLALTGACAMLLIAPVTISAAPRVTLGVSFAFAAGFLVAFILFWLFLTAGLLRELNQAHR